MKPSDRIHQIASARVPEGYPYEVTGADVMAYLDEQHEIERRRVYFRTAMACLAPNSGLQDKFNEYAEKAGLNVYAFQSSSVAETAAETIAEAEREGLL